ncbi:guanylate kinase [Rhodohalobacter barkolensis]|uniref:Guanylate kinase n=1 Tax=Rhodohalobacter barkolensis TaxID=2053187 RepID=A0A2N0VJ68_9BACT|nr:guanylate kinase [Rhodohalobacter barkolensis]PKD44229.1 guanylate kinase [Rhodohalobacter barkolensis]
MSKRGKILILVSPSGGGKSTMTKRLLKDFDKLKFSVSATTRSPRKGEKDGVHYHYLSKETFKQKIENDEFLEWEEFYNGTMYGTLRSVVENELNKGYFILLDIDVLGAKNVKKLYGDEALALFIKPPSLEVLKDRLIARGTETEETLQTRIERAEKEMKYASDFDEVIINDDLETAYNRIKETVSTFINS